MAAIAFQTRQLGERGGLAVPIMYNAADVECLVQVPVSALIFVAVAMESAQVTQSAGQQSLVTGAAVNRQRPFELFASFLTVAKLCVRIADTVECGGLRIRIPRGAGEQKGLVVERQRLLIIA